MSQGGREMNVLLWKIDVFEELNFLEESNFLEYWCKINFEKPKCSTQSYPNQIPIPKMTNVTTTTTRSWSCPRPSMRKAKRGLSVSLSSFWTTSFPYLIKSSLGQWNEKGDSFKKAYYDFVVLKNDKGPLHNFAGLLRQHHLPYLLFSFIVHSKLIYADLPITLWQHGCLKSIPNFFTNFSWGEKSFV